MDARVQDERSKQPPRQPWPHQPAHAHPADTGACCNCFSTIVKSKDGRRWCEAGCGEVLFEELRPSRKEPG